MILRDIDFGPCTGASGVQGWFGEGYRWHRNLKRLRLLNFNGMSLVAKTTTLLERAGNMPLDDSLQPTEKLPKCVKIEFWKGAVLNAVGLSGPGLRALLDRGEWQKLEDPFFLSLMAVGPHTAARLKEVREMVTMLRLERFEAPYGIQLNLNCPNTGHSPTQLVKESQAALKALKPLNVPIVPKINAFFPVEAAIELQKQQACDAICISNTIPWGQLGDQIDWEYLFGSQTSPLEEFGGGGLSGSPILPVVCDWIARARTAGLQIPLNAGGGICSKQDVDRMLDAGIDLTRDSLFLGSVAILRPYRVRGIIKHIHKKAAVRR